MLYILVKEEILPRPILRGRYIDLAVVRVALPEKIILDPEFESPSKLRQILSNKKPLRVGGWN